MKIIITLIPLLIIACAETKEEQVNSRQSCEESSFFLGDWKDVENNKISFESDCRGYTEDSCDLRFTYYKPVNENILVSIEASNDNTPGCPEVGELKCTIREKMNEFNQKDKDKIVINCGPGDIEYSKDYSGEIISSLKGPTND